MVDASPLGVSAVVSPVLVDAVMAGLGCWSFLSPKQASKGVPLAEGTTLVPLPGDLHAVEMQVWEQGMSAKEICKEKKGFSMERSLAN